MRGHTCGSLVWPWCETVQKVLEILATWHRVTLELLLTGVYLEEQASQFARYFCGITSLAVLEAIGAVEAFIMAYLACRSSFRKKSSVSKLRDERFRVYGLQYVEVAKAVQSFFPYWVSLAEVPSSRCAFSQCVQSNLWHHDDLDLGVLRLGWDQYRDEACQRLRTLRRRYHLSVLRGHRPS